MIRASLPGIFILLAGISGLLPIDGRVPWIFLLLAGIFLVL